MPMTARERELVGLLRVLEWSGRGLDGTSRCPVCHAAARDGVHGNGCRLDRLATEAGPEAPRWRHRARGTTYREVGLGTLKTNAPLTDGDTMMVYLADTDGALGVRAVGEFLDGRFERLE